MNWSIIVVQGNASDILHDRLWDVGLECFISVQNFPPDNDFSIFHWCFCFHYKKTRTWKQSEGCTVAIFQKIWDVVVYRNNTTEP